MATTPTGLTEEEATALSLSQQQQSAENTAAIQEGQYFFEDDEDGRRLLQVRGGQVVELSNTPPLTGGPEGERDWQGKTIGQWNAEGAQQFLSQAGIDESQVINLGDDANHLFRDAISGLSRTSTDLTGFSSGALAPSTSSGLQGLGGPTGEQQARIDASGAIPTPGSTLGSPDFQVAAGSQQPATDNPFFGIPAGAANTLEEAKILQAGGTLPPKAPVTDGTTATGGVQILNEQDLEAKRNELRAAGVPEGDFGLYISSPDAQGRLFFTQPATLTGKNGETRVVPAGSQAANDAFAQGFTLGDQFDEGVIDSSTLDNTPPTETSGVTTGKYTAQSPRETSDTSKTLQELIDEYIALQEVDTEATRREDTLEDDLFKSFGELEGRADFATEQLRLAGVAELKAELSKVKGNIRLKTAALEARLAEIGASPITQARRGGAAAAATRILQSEILFLQATAQFLMDDVNQGIATAQAAVDAKYNPILEKIDIQQQQLKLISDDADEDVTKYTNALNFALQKQADDVNTQKAVESAINGVLASYVNAGGKDQNVMDQIIGSGSEQEAIQIAGLNAPEAAPDLKTSIQTIGGRKVAVSLDSSGNVVNRVDLGSSSSGSGSGGGGFTPTQNKILEQAGLLGADRQTQLDHLFGGGDEESEIEYYLGQRREDEIEPSGVPAGIRVEVETRLQNEQEEAAAEEGPNLLQRTGRAVGDKVVDTVTDIYSFFNSF